MGVFNTNLSEITNGGLISSSHVSDLYDVLSGSIAEQINLSGSLIVTGSVSLGSTTISALTSSGITSTTFAFTSGSIGNLTSNISVTGNIASSGTASAAYHLATSVSASNMYVGANFITQGTVIMYTGSLPTTDPSSSGQLWRSGSNLMISLG